jgi:hypothetical protein
MNTTNAAVPLGIGSRGILIGEGIEEVRFFSALLKHMGLDGVQVENYKGNNGLELYLRTLKTRPGFASLEVLGITRDADLDPSAALASVEYALGRALFPNQLRVRSFILPSANQTGALEDLCLRTLAGSPLERCFDEYFNCAARITDRTFETEAVRAKARVHAWLAVQDPPDLRLGHAAEKGKLDWQSPVFNEMKEFLHELFG